MEQQRCIALQSHRWPLARINSRVADRAIDCLARSYAGTQGSHASESADDWVIVDSVRAPSTPGAYVLRWYAAAISYLALAATCSNASRSLARSDTSTSCDPRSWLAELTKWLAICLYQQALGHGAEPAGLDQLCGYCGRVMNMFMCSLAEPSASRLCIMCIDRLSAVFTQARVSSAARTRSSFASSALFFASVFLSSKCSCACNAATSLPADHSPSSSPRCFVPSKP
eukprot:COSAG06_NODE_668_length_13234_cov_75.848268_16_plen_228_part_00